MPPELQRLEKNLRQAAGRKRYTEVARLAAEMGERTREYVQSLAPGDPQRAQAVRNLDDLYSWTLVMMQAARASCLVQLRRAATANRYSVRPAPPAWAAGVRLDV